MDPAPASSDTRKATAVRALIAVTVGLWFLQLTVVSAADVRSALGFDLRAFLDGSWWTAATYMFVHATVWQLALNMYALWLFGPRVERLWGPGRFVGYYLLCGLGGWFTHLLLIQNGTFTGSTAAVLGVMLASVSQRPNDRVTMLGVVTLTMTRVVAALSALLLLQGASGDVGSGVAYFAHVGGLMFGWAYLRMAGSMHIDRLRQRVAPVADEPDEMPPRAIPPRTVAHPRSERDAREVDDIVAQSQAAVAERAAGAVTRGPARRGEPSTTDVNSILDKISAHGLDALTQAERRRLEDAARRLRDQ